MALSFAACFPTPAISSGKVTFRRTLRCSRRLKPWKIMEMVLRIRRSSGRGSWVMSCPSMMTLPELGRSRRLMQRTSVLLPAPESPMMPKISPSRMLRLMSRSASTSPEEEE